MGLDQGQDGAEIATEPNRNGRNRVSERFGVRDTNLEAGERQPFLEGVPGCRIDDGAILPGRESAEDVPGVFRGVGDGDGKEPGLVFRMQPERCRRDNEPGRALAFDEPRAQAAGAGLLDSEIGRASCRERV